MLMMPDPPPLISDLIADLKKLFTIIGSFRFFLWVYAYNNAANCQNLIQRRKLTHSWSAGVRNRTLRCSESGRKDYTESGTEAPQHLDHQSNIGMFADDFQQN